MLDTLVCEIGSEVIDKTFAAVVGSKELHLTAILCLSVIFENFEVLEGLRLFAHRVPDGLFEFISYKCLKCGDTPMDWT